MKLLFNQNLSPTLPSSLQDLFPHSVHVIDLHLDARADNAIWAYAKAHDFGIVTKDKDYEDLSRRLGPPPKVIRITSGNGPTSGVESLLRGSYQEISDFENSPNQGLFLL